MGVEHALPAEQVNMLRETEKIQTLLGRVFKQGGATAADREQATNLLVERSGMTREETERTLAD